MVPTGHSVNRHMELGQVLRLNSSYPAAVSQMQIAVRVSISLVLLHWLCYNGYGRIAGVFSLTGE
jgi:hypothetical protein